MKTITLFLVSVLFSGLTLAQSNKEDVDIIQAVIGKEKKATVADFLRLENGPKADAFWRLYDEYEAERKTLGRERIALLEKYAASYGTADESQIEQMIKETSVLQEKTDKLIIKYFDKMKKDAGVKTAAQFYQIEAYFLSLVRVAILGNIPFIDELNKKW